jgi:hypothetical protein
MKEILVSVVILACSLFASGMEPSWALHRNFECRTENPARGDCADEAETFFAGMIKSRCISSTWRSHSVSDLMNRCFLAPEPDFFQV